MVFARKSDAGLASLVKQLDKKLADNSNQHMAAFVNFLGSDAEALQDDVKQFGTKNKVEHVALVVPKEHENGPEEFAIDPQADVTVMIYRGLDVKANHTLAKGELNKKSIAAIVEDTAKILE